MSLIAIENLSKSFAGLAAVSEVSLSIGQSEFVTLLGPSGCGKTTTLRLIAGFMAPDAGRILVSGKVLSEPGNVTPPERRRMGMVFQTYAIWPHMTLFDNVAFGLKLQRLPRSQIAARVERMLSIVGLSGLEGRSPAQLSGGQQQRVALARSLVVEPAILLLDEPLSNLDAKLRERMRAELKALQRQTGITFIYVTHDQAEALTMSDRIAVFRAGRLQQVGAPVEVYREPANLFVADFMGQANKLDARVIGRGAPWWRVEAGAVTLMANPAGAAAADRVTLVLRPEAVKLDPPPGERPNLFDGRIDDVVFLGGGVEYAIALPGATIRAHALPDIVRSPGDRVRVELPPDACMAMAPDA